MRVLILSCHTGEGHNSAAYAVHEAFQRNGDASEVMDALRFGGERPTKLVTSAFNTIIRRTPGVFGFAYAIGVRYSATGTTSPIYLANAVYAKKLLAYILESRFDAVLCTHLFAMESLTYLRRREGLFTKCYGVLTDYTCFPFLAETEMDGYFIPHEDLLEECVGKGLPREKIFCTGIPVSQRFTHRLTRSEARSHLVIPENLRMYLIMTGGIGCGQVMDLCEKILERADGETVIYVLCGRNARLRADIAERYRNDLRVRAMVFTKKVNIYMNAADVLLSKPGGMTSTEAAVANVPLVHTMVIPGCETRNAAFFESMGMSLNAATLEEAARLAEMLAWDGEQAQEMLLRQCKTLEPYAADKIVTLIRQGCSGHSLTGAHNGGHENLCFCRFKSTKGWIGNPCINSSNISVCRSDYFSDSSMAFPGIT